jgi:hypothetical protein
VFHREFAGSARVARGSRLAAKLFARINFRTIAAPLAGRLSVRITSGVAFTMLLLTAPSFAEEQQTPKPNDPNEMICKNMQTVAGSRLGMRKECHTRREWDERRADDRQMTERAQQSDRRAGQ